MDEPVAEPDRLTELVDILFHHDEPVRPKIDPLRDEPVKPPEPVKEPEPWDEPFDPF
jgi:hypothetical protein